LIDRCPEWFDSATPEMNLRWTSYQAQELAEVETPRWDAIT